MLNSSLLQNLKILYIEDEPITRNMTLRFLKDKIGKIILAENGFDGINKFLEYRPDLVITDLVMPDMNGIEMIKKIRKKGFKCPVIITSSLCDSNTIIETVDLKIEKYMIKPIDTQKLLEYIHQIAIEELEVKKKSLVITEEEKKEFELEIRNIYSKHLKKRTGKGAKSIQVFIYGNEIEIISKDNLTTIEETFLDCGIYYHMIEIIRKTIYETYKKDLEDELMELIERKIKLSHVDIYPKRKFERVLFEIN